MGRKIMSCFWRSGQVYWKLCLGYNSDLQLESVVGVGVSSAQRECLHDPEEGS